MVRLIKGVLVLGVVLIIVVSMSDQNDVAVSHNEQGTADTTAPRQLCKKINDPNTLIAGFERHGVIYMQDVNRLVVNETLWWKLSKRQRIGTAAAYYCLSGRDVIRVTSSSTGRILARFVDGRYWEEN